MKKERSLFHGRSYNTIAKLKDHLHIKKFTMILTYIPVFRATISIDIKYNVSNKLIMYSIYYILFSLLNLVHKLRLSR